MGLDWMLDADKPKAGSEKQYRRIKEKLKALEDDKSIDEAKKKPLQKDLEAALKQVSVSPYQVVGAPQVGIDANATEWWRKQVFEPAQVRVAAEKKKPAPRDPAHPGWDDRNQHFLAYWDRPFEDVLKDEHGKYVVALAQDKEGIVTITGMMCSALDFRGQVVVLSVVVAEELRNEAYDDHDAEACVDYADRLEASLAAYKVQHPDWQTRHEKNDWGGMASAKDDAGEIESAVNWLRYWGSRGFGFTGWS